MTTTQTQQPEALRMAESLDELDAQFSHTGLCAESAAELRRLTAENEALRISGVYLVLQVIDCGGCPVLAFMDEQKANEYAAERSLAYQADRRAAVIKNCGYTDAQADAFAESMASQFYVEYVEVNP